VVTAESVYNMYVQKDHPSSGMCVLYSAWALLAPELSTEPGLPRAGALGQRDRAPLRVECTSTLLTLTSRRQAASSPGQTLGASREGSSSGASCNGWQSTLSILPRGCF